MSVVVSTYALPLPNGHGLGDGVEYRAPTKGAMARADLLEAVGDADALISLLTVPVNQELLDAAPKLKLVANVAVGYDNVDVPRLTERGVVCTVTPNVLTEDTADFAFALLLAAARRVVEGHDMVRTDRWPGWQPDLLLGDSVGGQVLGIAGLGRIGAAMARRAQGFGMRVLYWGRESKYASDVGAQRVDWDDLLAQSDFLSLHVPLNPGTDKLVDAAALGKMKPSAYLVNTARGACVDEAALVRALDAGEIRGAALDVFEREPDMAEALRRHPKVVLAPHAASATRSTRTEMVAVSLAAVRDGLLGRIPEYALNPEAWT